MTANGHLAGRDGGAQIAKCYGCTFTIREYGQTALNSRLLITKDAGLRHAIEKRSGPQWLIFTMRVPRPKIAPGDLSSCGERNTGFTVVAVNVKVTSSTNHTDGLPRRLKVTSSEGLDLVAAPAERSEVSNFVSRTKSRVAHMMNMQILVVSDDGKPARHLADRAKRFIRKNLSPQFLPARGLQVRGILGFRHRTGLLSTRPALPRKAGVQGLCLNPQLTPPGATVRRPPRRRDFRNI